MVEQHGGDDAGVAGVVVGERGVGRVVAAEAFGGGLGLGDRGGHLRGVRAQYGRQDLAERGLFGVGAQQVGVGLEGVDAEALDEACGLFGVRNPHRPSNGVRAQISSGLWLASL